MSSLEEKNGLTAELERTRKVLEDSVQEKVGSLIVNNYLIKD